MKTRRGVTLIELLVAMCVSGLVLIAVLGIFGFATRRLSSETGRAQTIVLANAAMTAVCKEISQAVSYGIDQNGDFYILPPASTDSSGNALGTLVGGLLNYSASTTGVKFYPADDAGGVQGSNTGGTLPANITCLWRATSNKLNGNPKWQPDAAWSQMQTGKTGPAGKAPEYPDVSSLTFTTTGMPANTVQVTLVMTDKEGGTISNYTLTRNVYLANHN